MMFIMFSAGAGEAWDPDPQSLMCCESLVIILCILLSFFGILLVWGPVHTVISEIDAQIYPNLPPGLKEIQKQTQPTSLVNKRPLEKVPEWDLESHQEANLETGPGYIPSSPNSVSSSLQRVFHIVFK